MRVILLVVTFVVTQFCCAPPMRAAQPAQCPITKGSCEASNQGTCSGGPQLVAEAPVKKFTAPQEFRPVAVIAGLAVAQPESVVIAGWWSVPTRTIQLRI